MICMRLGQSTISLSGCFEARFKCVDKGLVKNQKPKTKNARSQVTQDPVKVKEGSINLRTPKKIFYMPERHHL